MDTDSRQWTGQRESMEATERAATKLYFDIFPQWVDALLAIGCVVAFSWRSTSGLLTGMLMIAVSMLKSVAWLKLRTSDEQFDSRLAQDLDDLKPRALSRSGLDESETVRSPVLVVGPRFSDMGGAIFGYRKGKDGSARFTPLNITIINFTEHQLVAYQCAFDCMTGKPLNETVNEFFYNHIVAVATRADAVTYSLDDLDQHLLSRLPRQVKKSAVDGKIQINSAETFVLSTSGEASIRVVLNAPVLIQGLGGGDLPVAWAEEAVQAVRKMLRERNAGLHAQVQ